MNFKNLAENLIIVILSALVGGHIGYTASFKANKQVVEQLRPTIEKAIDKETIKNEIKNEINIDKIKKSDSLHIILDPTNNQKPTNTIIKKCEDGNICIPIINLTRRQKKRLGI